MKKMTPSELQDQAMLNESSDQGRWQTLAAAWELLSLSFAYPTPELVEALTTGEWSAAVDEIAEALDIVLPESPSSAHVALADVGVDEVLHSLRVDATRLFVGSPNPVVSPFEGVHRAATDGVQALLFVNPHSMEVERTMKAYGVGRPEGTNEPLDHVATECAFLQYLCMLEAHMAQPAEGVPVPDDGWAGAYDRFLNEHARTWMPEFADQVCTEAREPFYRVAAGMLVAMVGTLR